MSKIVYDPPWICYLHNFFTHDKKKFIEHLHTMPHTVTGSGNCESCGIHLDFYEIPFESFNEPIIILCEICEKIPTAKEHVRARRRSEYPPEKSVKSF